MNKKIVTKEIPFNGSILKLETGIYAPQANMAVLATLGETVVLATVVCNEPQADLDYFPLRVDYEEKLYAGGFIKTSRFIKREGRPTDEATITARLIDHAIRPLFPKDFMNDTQVIVTVLSLDEDHNCDVLSMIAASAVLTASDVPFAGPFASVRVGLKDGKFVTNPSIQKEGDMDFNMVLSGLKGKVLACEAEAKEIEDKKIYEAFEYGLFQMEPIFDLINDFSKEVGTKKMEYKSFALEKALIEDVKDFVLKDVKKLIASKYTDRVDQTLDLEEKLYEKYEGKHSKSNMKKALEYIEKEATQELILKDGKRPDGRKFDEIRDLSAKIGVLPRTHGSGFFQRGLTQSLTVVTLGSPSLEQLIHSMYGEETKRYIHHYNGAPFSLGETGRMLGPGRREIGHGALAEKALEAVIPSSEEFPYTIRLVSEILSQQGSSSMAAVCGSTLALMDAGVPIKALIAGVAVGLMTNKDESKYVALTDIANFEDFYGFMDYKMTGSRKGVTAIQLDIKLKGIPLKVFKDIIEASKKGRLKILDFIETIIKEPRKEISVYAPRVVQIEIKKDQIGLVIGSGGKTIKEIIEKTGATIDVEEKEDKGVVNIASKDKKSIQKAKEIIEALVKEIQIGEIYEGDITRVEDYGAFVEILPGKEGLLHVSEISHEYVSDPRSLVKVGDKVKVKVIATDRGGKISLSIKSLSGGGDAFEQKRNDRGGFRGPPKRDFNPGWKNRPPRLSGGNERSERPGRGRAGKYDSKSSGSKWGAWRGKSPYGGGGRRDDKGGYNPMGRR